MSTTALGGWTPYHPLTAKDLAVFNAAAPEPYHGVVYKPESVSTQLVAGENYRFHCKAEPLLQPIIYHATVQIFAPLEGKPYVTHITPH